MELKQVPLSSIDIYINKAVELAMTYAPKLALAIIFLLIGLKLTKIISKIAEEALLKSNIEPTIRLFLSKLIFGGLRVLLYVSVASMVGIETTSFVAMIGAAGLAIGLAFQGTLSNFAGGVLILTLKPFRVGDTINAQGFAGTVSEISIFNTIILTGENREALIPNGVLANSSLMNMSAKSTVRAELKFFIPTNGDIALAKKLIMNILARDKRILPDPAPVALVSELTETSIILIARVWSKQADHGNVISDNLESIKTALNEHGLFYLKS